MPAPILHTRYAFCYHLKSNTVKRVPLTSTATTVAMALSRVQQPFLGALGPAADAILKPLVEEYERKMLQAPPQAGLQHVVDKRPLATPFEFTAGHAEACFEGPGDGGHDVSLRSEDLLSGPSESRGRRITPRERKKE